MYLKRVIRHPNAVFNERVKKCFYAVRVGGQPAYRNLFRQAFTFSRSLSASGGINGCRPSAIIEEISQRIVFFIVVGTSAVVVDTSIAPTRTESRQGVGERCRWERWGSRES